jgi:hypothetical protein
MLQQNDGHPKNLGHLWTLAKPFGSASCSLGIDFFLLHSLIVLKTNQRI